MTLRCCTKHTSPSGTGTSDDPCFENSTLSPFATLICDEANDCTSVLRVSELLQAYRVALHCGCTSVVRMR